MLLNTLKGDATVSQTSFTLLDLENLCVDDKDTVISALAEQLERFRKMFLNCEAYGVELLFLGEGLDARLTEMVRLDTLLYRLGRLRPTISAELILPCPHLSIPSDTISGTN